MSLENAVHTPNETDRSVILTVTNPQPKKNRFQLRDFLSKLLSKKNNVALSSLAVDEKVKNVNITQPSEATGVSSVNLSQQVVHSFSPRVNSLTKKIKGSFLKRPRNIVVVLGVLLLGLVIVKLLAKPNTSNSTKSEVPYLVTQQPQSNLPATPGYDDWLYTTWGAFSFYYPFDFTLVNGSLSADHFVLSKTYSDNPVSFIQIEGLTDPINNNLKLAVNARKRGKGLTSTVVKVLSDQANGKDNHALIYEWTLSAVNNQKVITYEYFKYTSFRVKSIRVNAPELTWSTNSRELIGIVNAIVY